MGKPKTHFKKVMERLKTLGVENQRQLAEILKIKQPTVSDAATRGKFPLKWAEKLALVYGKSIDWILLKDKGEDSPSELLTGKPFENILSGRKHELNSLDGFTVEDLKELLRVVLKENRELREEIDRLKGTSSKKDRA